ncbi:FxsA domain protein [Natronomonas pharaonis DSM 2160]|uniref:FxsA domain protein n=1 Tax=Natronomonas pharaonis (strain ATCC 35678 / DSM 2160 / CIP 103997 / JCM 8858 / NBRC 14720 / NCIMB 2260 / Gabara) TaxID=348780 RepID=A0A1U7EVL9_NATPD|nr:FxsA family protein [Natronomonas pharaonis]CAI49072.1 FxsA domain protein [Natronomonas pharaonis DSM 2160]
MRLRVIGLLLLVPVVDILLLVVLATRLGPVTIGPVATVAVVVLTALLGLLFARAEGRHTLRKIQRKLANGDAPTNELLDGLLLIIAGTLMLTPGVITDFIGLLLVLPPTRYPIRIATKKYVVTPFLDDKTGGFASGNVYVGGFPGGDETAGQGFPGGGGPGGGFPGDASGPDAAGDTVEMGEADYEFTDPEPDEDDDTDSDRTA